MFTMLLIPLAVQTITDDSDRTLIESLYRQHYRMMRAAASRYCQEQMDIDDILSDSLVALIPKITLLRGMEGRAQSAYILTTVRNTAISYLRRRKLTSNLFQHDGEEALMRVADRATPEQRIILEDELNRVLQSIRALPAKEQAVLRMKYDMNLRNEEIAHALGLSEESIRKYLSRGRKRIKEAVLAKEAASHE